MSDTPKSTAPPKLSDSPLVALIQAGQMEELEKAWTSELPRALSPRADLLAVLDALIRVTRPDLAAKLAGQWVGQLVDRLGSATEGEPLKEALAVCRELLHRVDTGELRAGAETLYRRLYGSLSHFDAALTASGLNPLVGTNARRVHPKKALRVLDSLFALSPGRSYLAKRGEDRMARVEDIDPATASVTIQTAKTREKLTPSDVADLWEAVHPEDFRVLEQLNPARLGELMASDPAGVVVAILRARSGKVDSATIKKLLVPKYISAKSRVNASEDAPSSGRGRSKARAAEPPRDFEDWWARARAALRKDPHIRIEGRTPVTVVYDPAGRNAEQELLNNFAATKARGPAAQIGVLTGYLRDCKTTDRAPDANVLKVMEESLRGDLMARIAKNRSDLVAAVLLDRLDAAVRELSATETIGGTEPGKAAGVRTGDLPDDKPREPDASPPATAGTTAARLLRESTDPAALLTQLADDEGLWLPVLEDIRRVWPTDWPDWFCRLLPTLPHKAADAAAARLIEHGHTSRVKSVITEIFNKPDVGNLPGLLWLWKGPAAAKELAPPSRLNLLTKLLELLKALGAREGRLDEATRNAKAEIKAALQAQGHKSFRDAIDRKKSDAQRAAVVRRQIERCDTLGPSLQDELTAIIREVFPEIFKKAKLPPWEEKDSIWTTEAGLLRRRAEYEELVNVKLVENAKAIAAAREHGDLKENADYIAAKEEQDRLQKLQIMLQRELETARTLTPELVPLDHVGIGSRVTLVNTADGSTLQVTLLGPWDADRERNIYPYEVPMFKPLLGQKLGTELDLTIGGRVSRYRIENLEVGVEDTHQGAQRSTGPAPARAPEPVGVGN